MDTGNAHAGRSGDDAARRGTGRMASAGRPDRGVGGTDWRTAYTEYMRLLNILREIGTGQRGRPTGYYFGDGVARTLDGTPFEPLDWGEVRQA